jgi:hypothetical protein
LAWNSIILHLPGLPTCWSGTLNFLRRRPALNIMMLVKPATVVQWHRQGNSCAAKQT